MRKKGESYCHMCKEYGHTAKSHKSETGGPSIFGGHLAGGFKY